MKLEDKLGKAKGNMYHFRYLKEKAVEEQRFDDSIKFREEKREWANEVEKITKEIENIKNIEEEKNSKVRWWRDGKLQK